jgi:hypothetical protein
MRCKVANKISTPRPRRVQLNQATTLITGDQVEVQVLVLDLSKNGFRLAASEELFVGERVQLSLGRTEQVAAEILWVRGLEVGGKLLNA